MLYDAQFSVQPSHVSFLVLGARRQQGKLTQTQLGLKTINLSIKTLYSESNILCLPSSFLQTFLLSEPVAVAFHAPEKREREKDWPRTKNTIASYSIDCSRLLANEYISTLR